MKNMVNGLTWIKMLKQLCERLCVYKKAKNSFKHDLHMKLKKKLDIAN